MVTPIINTLESVWVQLYIGEEKSGDAFEIYDILRNLNDLKQKVIGLNPDLGLVLRNMAVFADGADPATDEPLRPDEKVSDLEQTEYAKPLIVVAPQQQRDGE
jgi:hypothetical protein